MARLDDKGGTTDDSGTWGTGSIAYNGGTVGLPYGGLNEESDQNKQTRTGAMGVFQFKPNERFQSELDLFYSKYTFEDQLWEFQMGLTGATDTCYGSTAPCNPSNPDYVVRQPQPVLTNATVVGGVAVSGTIDGIRPVMQNIAIGSNQRLESLGWNTSFKVTDNLTLAADVNLNDARNQQYDIETYASTPTTGLGGAVPNTTNITYNSNNLQIGSSLDFSNRNNSVFTDVLGWSCCQAEQPGYIKYPLTEDKMEALKLSGQLDLPDSAWFKDLDFGVNYSDREKQNSTTEGYLWVKGSNGALYQNGAHIPGTTLNVAGESGLEMPTYNVFNLWSQYFDVGSRATPNILAKTWSVTEKLTTAYARLDLKGAVGDVPVRGNVGVQVVDAQQSSTAYVTNQISSGTDALAPNTTPQTVTLGKTLVEILPSANLIGDLGTGKTLRLSLARQMARPNMEDMNASILVAPGLNSAGQQELTASGGNPYLKPFVADAVDISFEKYLSNKALFGVAGFYKHLETFIVTTTNDTFNFANYVTPAYLSQLPSSTLTTGAFTNTQNGTGGFIYGYELQASFPFSILTQYADGFGLEANFTDTESSIVAPNAGLSGSGATDLPGLSRQTMGGTLYYEKYGFEARVSDHYRSQFIGTLITNFGIPGNTYIRGYSLLDAQVSYTIPWGPLKNLQLQIQGRNLTNEAYRTYTNGGATVNSYTTQHFGQTFLFGINYKY